MREIYGRGNPAAARVALSHVVEGGGCVEHVDLVALHEAGGAGPFGVADGGAVGERPQAVRQLVEPVGDDRRLMTGWDTGVLWASLGCSFLVMVVGMFLVPSLSLPQALAAIHRGDYEVRRLQEHRLVRRMGEEAGPYSVAELQTQVRSGSG